MLLKDVKLYLRVDDYTEDEVIQGMIDAAKQYIQTGTGVTFDETNARHLLTLKMIVAITGGSSGIRRSFRSP